MSLELAWFSVAITVFSTASGQLTYKLFSLKKKSWLFFVAVFCFGLAQLANYFALRSIPIGVTYMMMASNYIIILFASALVLKEKINRTQVYAVILIVLGILLYSTGYLF